MHRIQYELEAEMLRAMYLQADMIVRFEHPGGKHAIFMLYSREFDPVTILNFEFVLVLWLELYSLKSAILAGMFKSNDHISLKLHSS